ncbi:hypothetical protein FFA01_17470 [Frigoribacterium faeni]|uniref:Uncharacterized protein n=2 Tax=Frigoribacterium faeni TaxID=145483 RepID=A0ABQ0UPM5_9MICO|nr:hypothetical protein GCM10025699_56230 [Microbacterium flavescens]GEK83438.1 hypothetical protein FFA01_17470 [Frigoribacterium faeni]
MPGAAPPGDTGAWPPYPQPMESSTTRRSSLARLGVVLGVFGVVAGVASVLIQDMAFRSAGSTAVYTSEQPFDWFAFSLTVSAVLILAALVAVAVAAVIASVLLVRWARRSREAA